MNVKQSLTSGSSQLSDGNRNINSDKDESSDGAHGPLGT